MRSVGIVACITGGTLAGVAIGSPNHQLILIVLGLVVIVVGSVFAALSQ